MIAYTNQMSVNCNKFNTFLKCKCNRTYFNGKPLAVIFKVATF